MHAPAFLTGLVAWVTRRFAAKPVVGPDPLKAKATPMIVHITGPVEINVFGVADMSVISELLVELRSSINGLKQVVEEETNQSTAQFDGLNAKAAELTAKIAELQAKIDAGTGTIDEANALRGMVAELEELKPRISAIVKDAPPVDPPTDPPADPPVEPTPEV